MPQAIERSLATPITNPFFPAINGPGLATSFVEAIVHTLSIGLSSCLLAQLFRRRNTSVALVPPKPKLFDITLSRETSSMRLRAIGISAQAGSMVSILADSQMN